MVAIALGLGGLELGLAGVGVEPYARQNDTQQGFSGGSPLFEPAADRDGWVETAASKRRFFNDQRFLADKPPGTKRLFCLGGSTSYGRPYRNSTSFCGWLQLLLEQVDPSSSWQTINAGGISYASYRVERIVEELERYSPDVLVVYTGHNEFLEERTYREHRQTSAGVRVLAERLGHSRVFSLVAYARDRFAPRVHEGPSLSAEVETILDRSIGPAAYERDDELRSRIEAEFEANLTRIVERARSYGAEPVLVVPASNLLDSRPFRSVTDGGLAPAANQELEGALDEVARASERGDRATAEAKLRQVLAIDPRLPEANFELGRLLAYAGKLEESESALRRARDEDICPLRATTQLQQSVRDVASRANAPLLDFDALLRAESEREFATPILGASFFLDHVHPTIDGHGLLAAGLIDAMLEQSWIPSAPDWRTRVYPEVAQHVHASIGLQDRGHAWRNLAKVLSWAGKDEEAARMAQRADQALGGDSESRFISGSRAMRERNNLEAARLFRSALELDPDYAKAHANLGVVLARLGQRDQSLEHYDRALEIDPEYANAFYNRANLLSQLGQYEAAIDSYRRAIALDPKDVDARFNLASNLERAKRPGDALYEYRALLRYAPGDREAASRARELEVSQSQAKGG